MGAKLSHYGWAELSMQDQIKYLLTSVWEFYIPSMFSIKTFIDNSNRDVTAMKKIENNKLEKQL